MRRALLLLLLLPLSAAAETPREALLSRDRAFSKAAEARDAAAFRGFVADDVLTFGGGAAARGKMLEDWAPVFAADGPAMRWSPAGSEASAAGDLGYTWGTYERTAKGKKGGGSYVTIWRRGADGAYRVVLDIGTPPSPVQN